MQPSDVQQTLLKSFTLGGVGLHTAKVSVVRVRPALAGEGRYFVRVPEGTNEKLYQHIEAPQISEEELNKMVLGRCLCPPSARSVRSIYVSR